MRKIKLRNACSIFKASKIAGLDEEQARDILKYLHRYIRNENISALRDGRRGIVTSQLAAAYQSLYIYNEHPFLKEEIKGQCDDILQMITQGANDLNSEGIRHILNAMASRLTRNRD